MCLFYSLSPKASREHNVERILSSVNGAGKTGFTWAQECNCTQNG
jgi:hypothetical protein